jgi:hypothetical protein
LTYATRAELETVRADEARVEVAIAKAKVLRL